MSANHVFSKRGMESDADIMLSQEERALPPSPAEDMEADTEAAPSSFAPCCARSQAGAMAPIAVFDTSRCATCMSRVHPALG